MSTVRQPFPTGDLTDIQQRARTIEAEARERQARLDARQFIDLLYAAVRWQSFHALELARLCKVALPASCTLPAVGKAPREGNWCAMCGATGHLSKDCPWGKKG